MNEIYLSSKHTINSMLKCTRNCGFYIVW